MQTFVTTTLCDANEIFHRNLIGMSDRWHPWWLYSATPACQWIGLMSEAALGDQPDKNARQGWLLSIPGEQLWA